MGMTIDKAIPILHDMYNYYNDTDIDAYVGFDKEDNNAIETALDTMRKYEKIEQIYQKWIEVNDFSYNQAMSQIGVVLEDGNDD